MLCVARLWQHSLSFLLLRSAKFLLISFPSHLSSAREARISIPKCPLLKPSLHPSLPPPLLCHTAVFIRFLALALESPFHLYTCVLSVSMAVSKASSARPRTSRRSDVVESTNEGRRTEASANKEAQDTFRTYLYVTRKHCSTCCDSL